MKPSFTLSLPSWLADALPPAEMLFATPEERMRLVLELARLHVAQGMGGPFAAAVFDLENGGRLVAPGVNLVLSAGTSVAHAEIVAIIFAQQHLGSYDLGSAGQRLELVTSTEPCAMCYGAVPWSGGWSAARGARTPAASASTKEKNPPTGWPHCGGATLP